MYRVKAGQHRRRAGKTKDAKVRDHLFERAAACERQARRLEDAKNQRGAR
jgi:hypothetical protein